MSGRFTIVATAILVLTAVVYFLDRTPEPPPRRVGLPGASTPRPTLPPVTPIVGIKAERFRKLVLRIGPETRVTERTGNGWSHTDRSSLVEDFVADLTSLGVLDRIAVENADALQEYGLLPPQAVLEIHTLDSERPIEVYFGNLNPPGTNLYLRVPPSQDVLLGGALLKWSLERTFQVLHSSEPSPAPIQRTNS